MSKSFNKSHENFQSTPKKQHYFKNVNFNTLINQNVTRGPVTFQGVTPNNLHYRYTIPSREPTHIPPGKKIKFIFNKMRSKGALDMTLFDMLVPRRAWLQTNFSTSATFESYLLQLRLKGLTNIHLLAHTIHPTLAEHIDVSYPSIGIRLRRVETSTLLGKVQDATRWILRVVDHLHLPDCN